ncbi:MAG: death on curing protein [Parcubacteria group bacterium Greene0714_21]|nr:MAG: death on curing protein [Parcubacteria group bacterium Greene0416_39]TSC97584.1 MAG: death on curing protein [Parcubacteria group bacterium Greene1014_47]TSD04453.1 MAG: death on curing protein [Parcubacteria group bacterium Greene0714_21]
MRYLTKEQILLIHSMIIDETGGSHGVRDYDAILSLESLPRQSVFGKELYPTLFAKAAVYARNIISGHPFVDGNKRTAMTAASVFLEDNGYKLAAEKGTVEKFALRLIKEKLNIEAIASWFKKNTGET